MTKGFLLPVLLCAAILSGCALRSPRIADVQRNPGRFTDRTVEIHGVVTTSWGIPLVPFKLYKVDDGTGEMTVVGRGTRVPSRGARVRVRGRVNELGVFGGNSLGLHIEEHSIHIDRRS
ncbi:MAG: hypothetical protein U0Q12_05010 [Vicinamibacterales bacterium]